MKHSYYYNHINEGFDIFKNRRLHFTDAHEEIPDTSFDGNATYSKMFYKELKDRIMVYSIFKRMFRKMLVF